MDRNDLTTPFPLPPPHYTEFTGDYKSNNPFAIPPTPIQGDFTVFGQIDNINFQPKLSPDIPKLDFDLANRKDQLKEINSQLKSKFIDLLGALSTDTEGVSPIYKAMAIVTEIKLLFIHFQQGLNEYRPHQVDLILTRPAKPS